jgi:putative DNA primase/helicase
VSSARLFATRVRTERSLASPEQMIRSNGKKYYPGIALLPE